jgi:hypothetical protein
MEKEASETIARLLELVANAESKIAVLRECVDASRARFASDASQPGIEPINPSSDSCATEVGTS